MWSEWLGNWSKWPPSNVKLVYSAGKKTWEKTKDVWVNVLRTLEILEEVEKKLEEQWVDPETLRDKPWNNADTNSDLL